VPSAELDKDAVRRELEEVLKSAGFARNERLSSFLRFIVVQHLEGRDHELKESVIGSEVFGRKRDYSPKSDPIVRTEARRLRERLREYYEGSGIKDAVRIELPKGGYAPTIRGAEDEPVESDSGHTKNQPQYAQWWALGLACAGLSVVVLFGLTRFESRSGPRRYNRSPAFDLYVRARALQRRPALRGVQDSIDLFQMAIAKDPSFAPAYAGIAAAYAARSGFDQFTGAERADMLTTGWADAATAVQLDPQLADAYDALGMMQSREAQWARAESSFRRAVALAPRDALWRDNFAMFLLLPLGRIDEALTQLRIAEVLDPTSPATHFALIQPLTALGRIEEADSHCDRAAEDDQQRSVCWNHVLERQGRADEAIRMLEDHLNGHLLEPGAAQSLGLAYARAGRREDAERMAALAPRLASKAQIFAALGDKDRTFKILDQMIPMGPTRIGRDFLNSPNFTFLHGDPRLKALRKKISLPE
jgi:tetratricopeptide (TPR) repeat protein